MGDTQVEFGAQRESNGSIKHNDEPPTCFRALVTNFF